MQLFVHRIIFEQLSNSYLDKENMIEIAGLISSNLIVNLTFDHLMLLEKIFLELAKSDTLSIIHLMGYSMLSLINETVFFVHRQVHR